MLSGKGRIVLRSGFSLTVRYEYAPARRPGVLEGCFSGKLTRLERSDFYDRMTLICRDGDKIDLAVTTYSQTRASFSGTFLRAENAEMEEAARQIRRAVA
jgi:hypothetical protein